MKKVKHIGFAKAAESVARKQGLPIQRANAIIASGARSASPAAKKSNPKLKNVLPKKKK